MKTTSYIKKLRLNSRLEAHIKDFLLDNYSIGIPEVQEALEALKINPKRRKNGKKKV